MVLGLPSAIVLSASAAQTTAETGNLAETHLMVRSADVDGPFVPTPAEVDALNGTVDEIAATVDATTTMSLEVAFDATAEPDPGFDGLVAPSLAFRIEDGWADLSLIYVATPELLDHLGYTGADPEADILTTESGELALIGANPADAERGAELLDDESPLTATYTSLPSTFISRESLSSRGLETIASGRWLI